MAAESLFDQLFGSERASRVAVLYEHREVTYEDLRVLTVRTVEALYALGVSDGDRVAILLNDSPEFIASFVAIVSLGAIAVPINMALRRDDQLFILKDCGACAAIVEAQAAETLFSTEHQSTITSTGLKNLLVVRRRQTNQILIPEVRSQSSEEVSPSYFHSPLGD